MFECTRRLIATYVYLYIYICLFILPFLNIMCGGRGEGASELVQDFVCQLSAEF